MYLSIYVHFYSQRPRQGRSTRGSLIFPSFYPYIYIFLQSTFLLFSFRHLVLCICLSIFLPTFFLFLLLPPFLWLYLLFSPYFSIYLFVIVLFSVCYSLSFLCFLLSFSSSVLTRPMQWLCRAPVCPLLPHPDSSICSGSEIPLACSCSRNQCLPVIHTVTPMNMCITPNILLGTLFSDSLTLELFPLQKHEVIIHAFLRSRREDRRFWTSWQEASSEIRLVLTSSWVQFVTLVPKNFKCVTLSKYLSATCQ